MFKRNRRTAFLGVFATLCFVWAAIWQFDVPPQDLAWLLLYCVIGVVAIMVLAGLSVAVLIVLRKVLGAGD